MSVKNFRKKEYENNVPDGLFDEIMARIELEKKREAFKKRIIIFSFFSLVSFISLIPALRELQNEIAQSGFFHFISLILSDFSVVVSYWQDFLFSILESIPAFGMITVLGLTLALVSFMKIVFRDINSVFSLTAKNNV